MPELWIEPLRLGAYVETAAGPVTTNASAVVGLDLVR